MQSTVFSKFAVRLVPSGCARSLRAGHAASAFFSSSPASYDVAVVGGGPGGYVAAIKAAQLGLKTDAQDQFGKLGIHFEKCSFDLHEMQKKKGSIVKGLTMGIEMLFKMNKVDYKKGTASFLNCDTLRVEKHDGTHEEIKTKNIVLATGSESSPFPGGGIVPDEDSILTSTGALALTEVPKRLVVVGGGVIGLELGSVFRRLESQVVVVEFLNRITPGIDGEVGAALQKILQKQGFDFRLSTKVTGCVKKGKTVTLNVECVETGKTDTIECDKVLLAVGRRPYTENLGLEHLGVQLSDGGRIPINDAFQVKNHSNIYAIGDSVRGPMLAHKAEEEGIAVAEIIAKKRGHVNYDTIPSVVYTHPEVAGVGKTEEELISAGVAYTKGVFSFASNSRARANDDAEGFVKVLSEKNTDRLLGGWIVGPQAGELIQSFVLALEYGASSEDVARTCHAHPTLSEAIKEACLSAYDKPIHGAKK